MPETPNDSPEDEGQFHSYETHRIPWYVRAGWIIFWIALIWYVIQFGIPAAKKFLSNP